MVKRVCVRGIQEKGGGVLTCLAGDVIQITSADALKPFVVTIIGSLIRVISDRFPSEVKVAILETMGCVIGETVQEWCILMHHCHCWLLLIPPFRCRCALVVLWGGSCVDAATG